MDISIVYAQPREVQLTPRHLVLCSMVMSVLQLCADERGDGIVTEADKNEFVERYWDIERKGW